MFSKAKRFNYPEPEPIKEPSPLCQRRIKSQSSNSTQKIRPSTSTAKPSKPLVTSTSKISCKPSKPLAASTPKVPEPKVSEDISKLLEQLKTLEARMHDRCNTMETLCREYRNSPVLSQDDGFCSTRSSSPQVEENHEVVTAALEVLIPRRYEDFVEVCAQRVAELVCQKLDERRQRSFWTKIKMVVREFAWPKVADGAIE